MGLLIRDLDEFNPPVEIPQGKVTVRLMRFGGDFIEISRTDRGVTEMILTVPTGVSVEVVP